MTTATSYTTSYIGLALLIVICVVAWWRLLWPPAPVQMPYSGLPTPGYGTRSFGYPTPYRNMPTSFAPPQSTPPAGISGRNLATGAAH